LARIATSCPPSAVVGGVGCVGSAGLVTLAAGTLPWTGATFGSVAAGLPASSVAFGIWSLQPGQSLLASVLPQSAPGCLLYMAPQLLTVAFAAGGTAAFAIDIPNDVLLGGQTLLHQVVPLGLDASGAIVEAASSNALTLTIGSF